MKTISCVIFFLAFFCMAHAQVYKCQDSAGRTVYSDSRCDYAAKAIDPNRLNTNAIDASDSRRQVRASQRESSGGDRQSSTISGAGNVCPTDQEIKNLETSASSISLQDKRQEREFLQAEIRRARACSKEGGNYTDADWKRIKDEQAAQSNITSQSRDAARASAKSIHSSSASDRENERMKFDELIEAKRKADRRSRNCIVTGPNTAQCN